MRRENEKETNWRFSAYFRFDLRLKRDHEGCTRPDTKTPFRGPGDAVRRLLRLVKIKRGILWV